jgi:hypothetical protein
VIEKAFVAEQFFWALNVVLLRSDAPRGAAMEMKWQTERAISD